MTRDPWLELNAELDRWHKAGKTARFWLRDDDAVEPTPELERQRSQYAAYLAMFDEEA